MSKFFGHFPTIDYPGLGLIKDTTCSFSLSGNAEKLPYQQTSGSRPDILASKYYGDPVQEWLLYRANDVSNPRDLFYLTDDQFARMINRKFGSTEQAEKQTYIWRHNYRGDLGSVLDPQQFASLPADVQPLFDVIRDYRGDITGYTRKKVDIFYNTNAIYTITVADGSSFSKDQPIEITNNGARTASGEVTFVNGNQLVIQHVEGNPNGTDINGVSIVSVELTAENISATRAPYFERVSQYTHLHELNEQRREIQVFDKRSTSDLERQLQEAFR